MKKDTSGLVVVEILLPPMKCGVCDDEFFHSEEPARVVCGNCVVIADDGIHNYPETIRSMASLVGLRAGEAEAAPRAASYLGIAAALETLADELEALEKLAEE